MRAVKELVKLARAFVGRVSQHGGEPYPGAGYDMDVVADGLDQAITLEASVTVSDPLWRLTPAGAKAEVRRRLEVKVRGLLAEEIGKLAAPTYERRGWDGETAPDLAAGKNIAQHRMAVRFLIVPLPPPTGD